MADLKVDVNDSHEVELELFDEPNVEYNEEGPVHDKLEQFLVENHLQDYLTLFREQEIDFDTLMLLTETDLKSLGLPLGPFRKLTIALQKKKTCIETDYSTNKADTSIKDTSDLNEEQNIKALDEVGYESDGHSAKSDNEGERKNELLKKPEKNHPYAYDLLNFKLPDHFKQTIELQEPIDINKKKFELIESPPKLWAAIRELRKENIIAVDAKHVVNYEKTLSLLQLSTDSTDYLFDFSKMRGLELLMTDVFVNPHILKVFYDAKIGIKFLQENSCLFTINVYCVRSAVKELGYQTFSLYGLINKYVPFIKPKTTECTLRPLHGDLMANLRKETHYLLHLYYRTRNEAIEKGVFDNIVAVGSRFCCYSFLPDKEIQLCNVYKDFDKFNEGQRFAAEKLSRWRDYLAKRSNTKIQAILKFSTLRQLSLSLPNTAESLFRIADTPIVRTHFRHLLRILNKGRNKLLAIPADPTKYEVKAITPITNKNWTYRKGGGPPNQDLKRGNEGFAESGVKRFKRANLPNRNQYGGNKPSQSAFVNDGSFGGGFQANRMDYSQNFQHNTFDYPNTSVWQNMQNHNFNSNYETGFGYY
ncbi:hypothetical protein WA026_001635 [Henosepilachna vigintioctopunctata]|uniref:HRDC domain-containing protein n=1 Tax=Henosepilachna vigintioctopunctata TaxID=420089 RepID=A0AAW1UTY9_9CUCU